MTSIFNKLKQALTKTSDKISSSIDHIFSKKKIDKASLDELEDVLISADVGVSVTMQLIDCLSKVNFSDDITPLVVKEKLSEEISKILLVKNNEFSFLDYQLNIVFVCGVNGSGKTTTIGKLAETYTKAGKKVAVAACDTFRAAAVEQLETWAKKTGALFIKGEIEEDPASVAHKAITQSRAQNIDILFIDTAGRLHNNQNFMDELGKIVRVIKKLEPSAPHHSLLVLDGTTGQNVYNQVEKFIEQANITGLIVTKLDGTAKAGVIIGVVQKFGLPVYFLGIGEKAEDLRRFDHVQFSESLMGI